MEDSEIEENKSEGRITKLSSNLGNLKDAIIALHQRAKSDREYYLGVIRLVLDAAEDQELKNRLLE